MDESPYTPPAAPAPPPERRPVGFDGPMTLVYAPGGAVTHYADTGNERTTACGLVRINGWHGTGSQTEYEEAARRPLCRHCPQRANR